MQTTALDTFYQRMAAAPGVAFKGRNAPECDAGHSNVFNAELCRNYLSCRPCPTTGGRTTELA